MATHTIRSVAAREVLDGRLDPTLRVEVTTSDGAVGRADVPSGRSRGAHEAVDLRDGGERYGGRGVRTAVGNVEDVVAPELVGRDVTKQASLDETLCELDGTADKSELGGNALTGVSLAVAKAAAAAVGTPLYRYVGGADSRTLPVPFFDLIEGGELAASGLAFQEHQVVPTGASSFAEAIRMCAEVYGELGDRLAAEWGPSSLNVGDEGGYTPADMTDPRDAFDAELAAVEELGYGDEFDLAIDAAASQFYDPSTETYALMGDDLSRADLVGFYEDLVDAYPIVSIEDPLHEDDFEGFAELTRSLDAQVVGDDLFATNVDRLERGVAAGAADALLFKVNQVGTLTEALAAARTAHRNGYAVQVSERSGQTADTWLADVAVALDAGQIKTGVSRAERTEQYNRLLRIDEDLGGAAVYPTWE